MALDPKIGRATWDILGLSDMRHDIYKYSDMGHGHFLNSTGQHEHFLNLTGRHKAFLECKIRTPPPPPPSRAPQITTIVNFKGILLEQENTYMITYTHKKKDKMGFWVLLPMITIKYLCIHIQYLCKRNLYSYMSTVITQNSMY